MTTFTIPATIEEATAELEGIEALLTAKGWARAATVAAFVRLPGSGGPPDRANEEILVWSPQRFAALGIAGLTADDTVRRYAQTWLDHAGTYPEPGQAVDLPDAAYPKARDGNGKGYDSPAGGRQTIERVVAQHGPEVLADALERHPEAVAQAVAASPRVAEIIDGDLDASAAMLRAGARKRKAAEASHHPRPLPPAPDGPLDSILLLCGSAGLAGWSKKVLDLLTDRNNPIPWTPSGPSMVLGLVDEAIGNLTNIRAVLTANVTDEDLAALLGDH